MSRFLRIAEVAYLRLGSVGVFAVAVLVLCIANLVLVLLPLQGDIQEKSVALANLRKQPGSHASSVRPVLNDEQQLAEFYRQFPNASQLNAILEQLHQLAIDNGIVLATGEYKLSGDINNRDLVRYEIIFPVQASYAHLRAFIEAASQKFPTLGLSEINIKRESINESGAQIKLDYVLLMTRTI